MKGKRQAFQIEIDREIALAWRIENFARSGKKFKDLKHYLSKDGGKPRRRQSTAEMIAALRAVAAATKKFRG